MTHPTEPNRTFSKGLYHDGDFVLIVSIYFHRRITSLQRFVDIYGLDDVELQPVVRDCFRFKNCLSPPE